MGVEARPSREVRQIRSDEQCNNEVHLCLDGLSSRSTSGVLMGLWPRPSSNAARSAKTFGKAAGSLHISMDKGAQSLPYDREVVRNSHIVRQCFMRPPTTLQDMMTILAVQRQRNFLSVLGS